MEDYQAAYVARVQDVEVLHDAGRKLAAMHMGGIAIECLLKYLVPKSPTLDLKTHSYEAILRCHNHLRFRVEHGYHVQDSLYTVEHPNGYVHFIDIRYVGKEPGKDTYTHWRNTYQYLLRWLQKYSAESIK
jgi:hypothetical protein